MRAITQSFLGSMIVRVQLYGFLVVLYGQFTVTMLGIRLSEAIVDIGGIRIGFHIELENLDCGL